MTESVGDNCSNVTSIRSCETGSEPNQPNHNGLSEPCGQSPISNVSTSPAINQHEVLTPCSLQDQGCPPMLASDPSISASLCAFTSATGGLSNFADDSSFRSSSNNDPTLECATLPQNAAPADTSENQAHLTLAEAIHFVDTHPSNNNAALSPMYPHPHIDPTGDYDLSNESVATPLSDGDDAMQSDASDLGVGDTNQVDWLHSSPKLIAYAEKDYTSSRQYPTADNYLRGCLWAPDGSCILTNSRDNKLRLFNLPNFLLSAENLDTVGAAEEMSPVLLMQENELVYDYTWYPGMNSNDPTTCCFASSVRRNPIRLWDAFTGTVRAIYLPIGHLGDPISAFSVGFSSDGQRLYAGFNRFIHVFDVCRPGKESIRRPKLGKKPYQGGIISCFAVPRDPSRQLYATGSYNGTVNIYSESEPQPGTSIGSANFVARLVAAPSGVSQVLLLGRLLGSSGAPWYVAAGCRRDPRIFLWDARRLREPMAVLHRRVENYQRFQFDVEPSGRYLFTGSQTGAICVYDLEKCLTISPGWLETGNQDHVLSAPTCSSIWRAHTDCAHGLSVHPSLPIVATASGQRRVPAPLPAKRRVHSAPGSPPAAPTLTPPPSPVAQHQQQPPPSSSSSDDEEEESIDQLMAELTDDEASLLQPPGGNTSTDVCATKPSGLPLAGQLTRLPRENRLCLWAFPWLSFNSPVG